MILSYFLEKAYKNKEISEAEYAVTAIFAYTADLSIIGCVIIAILCFVL